VKALASQINDLVAQAGASITTLDSTVDIAALAGTASSNMKKATKKE